MLWDNRNMRMLWNIKTVINNFTQPRTKEFIGSAKESKVKDDSRIFPEFMINNELLYTLVELPLLSKEALQHHILPLQLPYYSLIFILLNSKYLR